MIAASAEVHVLVLRLLFACHLQGLGAGTAPSQGSHGHGVSDSYSSGVHFDAALTWRLNIKAAVLQAGQHRMRVFFLSAQQQYGF